MHHYSDHLSFVPILCIWDVSSGSPVGPVLLLYLFSTRFTFLTSVVWAVEWGGGQPDMYGAGEEITPTTLSQ